jgi:hypothetical protein
MGSEGRAVRRLIFLLFAVLPGLTFAAPDPLAETRYCGEPKRAANGHILRRADVLVAFRHLYACPGTGLHQGPCPGWAIDHVVPLAVGGCDAVRNLQWLPAALKSCSGGLCKDRWERTVYKR